MNENRNEYVDYHNKNYNDGYNEHHTYTNGQKERNRGILTFVLTVLLIPLVAFGAFYAWKAFTEDYRKTAANINVVSPVDEENQNKPSPTPTSDVKVGVGAGAQTSITPTSTSSRRGSPTPSVTQNNNTQKSTVQQGVGGSSGPSATPQAAPYSGQGGVQ